MQEVQADHDVTAASNGQLVGKLPLEHAVASFCVGHSAPPLLATKLTERERVFIAAAPHDVVQVDQLPHEETIQSTGHSAKEQAIVAVRVGHAGPPPVAAAVMDRERVCSPFAQETEQGDHKDHEATMHGVRASVGAGVTGAGVVGATVVGATVGVSVVGAKVVGVIVVGARVVGARVVGARVVGVTVVGAKVVGATDTSALSACALSLDDVQARTRRCVWVDSVHVSNTAWPVVALTVHCVLLPEPASVTAVAVPWAPQLGELPTAEVPER